MPSVRMQMAGKKRSRQSHAMSDIENMDVMLGNFTEDDFERQGKNSKIRVDLESDRLHRDNSQAEENFR